MFDVSIGELAVVVTVIVAAVGPKELPNTLRTLLQAAAKVREVADEARAGLDRLMAEAKYAETKAKLKEHLQEIVDLEGNVQQAFDLSDLCRDFGKEVPSVPPPAVEAPKP